MGKYPRGRGLCCCCGFSEREYYELLEYIEDDTDSRGDVEGVRKILRPYPEGFCNSIKYLNERTPLLVAATVGNVDVVRVLVLEFGANVLVKDFNGCTALHKAAENGRMETVKLLVDELGSQSDIHVETPFRQTPLHLAAYHGHLEIVKYLVESGAKIGARDSSKRTAMECAQKEGYTDVVEYLRNAVGEIKTVEERNDENVSSGTRLLDKESS